MVKTDFRTSFRFLDVFPQHECCNINVQYPPKTNREESGASVDPPCLIFDHNHFLFVIFFCYFFYNID